MRQKSVASPNVTGEVSTTETAPRAVTRIGMPLILVSVLGSTLGIVLAQWTDNLGVGLLAEILGGDAVVHSNRVVFEGASDLAWAGGFLLCLIVGFICLLAYPNLRDRGSGRLVFLWVLLHMLRQAMTGAVVLPFDETSRLARAYSTFDVPGGLDMVIAAAGAIGLLLIALSAAAAFLAFAPHRRLVSNGRRRLTLGLWLILIPAVASAFLAIPFFMPDVESMVIPTLPLTPIMFLATLAAIPGTTTVQGPDELRVTPFPWALIAFMAVLLVLDLWIFRGGFHVDPRLWGQ
jgi:hypothetical protein